MKGLRSNINDLPFPIMVDALTNMENYGVYQDLVMNGTMSIHTSIFNPDNIDQHFHWILNIFSDGIEQEKVQNMILNVTFVNNVSVRLSIFDYWVNIIMWNLPVCAGDPLTSEFLFFEDATTGYSIKSYIDDKFIDKHRVDMETIKLNNIIDDTIYRLGYVDKFSTFLANTICDEDMIDLMREDPKVYQMLHLDVSNVPIDQVRDYGMKVTNELVRIISKPDSKHCLRDSFRAKEAINPKQFKEYAVNIGTKPDGNGGVYPHAINTSYLMRGVKDYDDYFIDSANGRQSLIIQKENVGSSGSFSRRIGLNNMETKIYPNPEYECNTKTLVPVYMKDEVFLQRFRNRWFAYNPNGVLYKISNNPMKYNQDLIGKVLYLRSPITCASHSRGLGYCYKCYGDLAYINYDINVGKMASEILAAQLTQKLLSAKHLLETRARTIQWVDEFNDIFVLNVNLIKIQDDFKTKKWKLLIDADEYDSNDNQDDMDYNNSITSFKLIDPFDNEISIHTLNYDALYFSREFDNLIQSRQSVGDYYEIQLSELENITLFKINITNVELYDTLNMIKSILDKNSITKDKTIQESLDILLSTIIDGGINIDAVHVEVLLSNQIRRKDNILLTPEWEYPNEPYQIITLDKALKDNPSIAISLSYGKIKKALITPSSYQKTKPSCLDLFYMEQPQPFMNKEVDEHPEFKQDHPEMIRPFYRADKKNDLFK